MAKKIQAKPVIRGATAMDATNIVRLIKDGWKETPAVGLAELEELKLLDYVSTTLRRSFAIVAEHSGRILGSVALAPIVTPWTTGMVMAETWLAVRPEQRDTITPRLLDAVEEFLEKNNLPCFMGTQMLTPGIFNQYIESRPRFKKSRATFLRLPMPVAKPKEEKAA